MTFLARTVEDDVRSIFFRSLRLEVELFLAVSQVHPDVVKSELRLFPIVRGRAFRRKMAFCAICVNTAFVQEVHTLLPTCFSLGMHMTSHARFVCRGDVARI